MSVFKCPYCGTTMTNNNGPNWTTVPGANYGNLVVLSCINVKCQGALGAAHVPPPPQQQMGRPFT